ncbi:MAG: hypothetical protein AAF492_19710, partial [Verrucomicrobiota bacterium]
MPATIQVSRSACRLLTVSLLLVGLLQMAPAVGQSPHSARVSDLRETPTVLAIRRASPAVVNIHGQKTVRASAAGMAG